MISLSICPAPWQGDGVYAKKENGDSTYSFLKLEVLQEGQGPSLVLTGDTIDLKDYAQLQELSGKPQVELAFDIFKRFQEDHGWEKHGIAVKTASGEEMEKTISSVSAPGFMIPKFLGK